MLGNIPQTISHCLHKLVVLAHPPHLPIHYSAGQVGICIRAIPVSDKVILHCEWAVPNIYSCVTQVQS